MLVDAVLPVDGTEETSTCYFLQDGVTAELSSREQGVVDQHVFNNCVFPEAIPMCNIMAATVAKAQSFSLCLICLKICNLTRQIHVVHICTGNEVYVSSVSVPLSFTVTTILWCL